MDCSTPGLPVYHQLSELAQTHIYWVSDAIQTLHPLSSPSSPTFIFSQHQGLFNESVLRIRRPKYRSWNCNEHWGLISFRTDLQSRPWISLQSKGLSRVFSNTTVQKHQLFSVQLSLLVQLSHPYMTIGEAIALIRQNFVGKIMCLLFICCLGWSQLFFQGASIF